MKTHAPTPHSRRNPQVGFALSLLLVLTGLGQAPAQDAAPPSESPFKKSSAPAPAQIEPAAAPERLANYRLRWEFITVPRATAWQLLADHAPEAVYPIVKKALEDGDAAYRLESLVVQQSRSGCQTKTKGVQEIYHPTEFDSPQIPQTVTPSPTPTAPAGPTPTTEPAPSPLPKAALAPGQRPFPYVPASPTTFEMRNVGITVEVGVSEVPEQEAAVLSAAVEIVSLAGWQELDAAKEIVQPDFYSLKAPVSNRSVALDLTTLVSGLPDPQQPDRFWLTFVTVHRVALPAPATKPKAKPTLVTELFSASAMQAWRWCVKAPTDAELRLTLAAAVGTQQAKLEELNVTVTEANGYRDQIESGREFIYPTEFEPSQIPQKGPSQAMIRTATTPTTFDTRPLGFTMETEINTKEVDEYEMTVAAQRTTFEGWEDWGGHFPEVKQPRFNTQQVSGLMRGAVGQPLLIGTFNPPPGEDLAQERVWFLFTTLK